MTPANKSTLGAVLVLALYACGPSPKKPERLFEAVRPSTGERFVYDAEAQPMQPIVGGGCLEIKDVQGWSHSVCEGNWKVRPYVKAK